MFSRISNIFIISIILIALGGVLQATAATEEEMRAAMQGILDALNAHDVAQMSLYWTDDIVYDFVAQPPPMNGKEEVAAFFGGLFQGIPDFHSTHTRILVSGNIMVTEAMGTGTHLGEFLGIPATGNSVQTLLLHIWEFEGDKVKRATEYADVASLMVQLGVMPAPELDPELFVPSFTLPDAEPTGLSPVETAAELDARWDANDMSGCAKIIYPDAEILFIPFGVPMDREGFIALSELEFLGFSDLRWEPVRSIDMGDGWVVTETVTTGTHDGPYMGIPATGHSITLRAAVLRRFDADGLLTNLHLYYDNLSVLAQLGLIPPPVDTEANKAIVQRWVELWNTGDLAIADEIFAADYVSHVPQHPHLTDRESYKSQVIRNRTDIPDLHVTVEDMVAEGDKVATRFTVTGTHQSAGVQYTNTTIAIFHFADGKIVEEWFYHDMLGVLEQIGVMPRTREDYTWGDPSAVTGDPGDPETNKAIVQRSEEIWNIGNLAILDEIYGAEFVNHDPTHPDVRDLESYKQFIVGAFAAFPDFHVATEDVFAEGDKVATRWTATATPTGRQVTWTGMTIHRFADGKIVESWMSQDILGLMQQLTMSQEEANKAIVERWVELWNTGDLAIADEIFATDFVNHDLYFPDVTDLESYKEYVVLVHTGIGISDIHLTVHDMVAQGDKVAYRYTTSYTIPDGKQVTVTSINIDHFADGKIVEERWSYDMLGSLEQRGVMPPTREDYTWGEPSEVTGAPGTPEENKELVKHLFGEVLNKQNVAVVDEIMATNVVFHDPVTRDIIGIEGFKQFLTMYFTAFPDLHFTIEDQVAEGDKVVIRYTATGTHEGELMGIPPTGVHVVTLAMIIYRFADGKIVEIWSVTDNLGLLQRLTAPPPVPEGIVVDEFTSPSLEGNLLGDPATRNMTIYLPPGYDTSERRYPVVYLLHGFPFGEAAYFTKEGWLAAFGTEPDLPENGFNGMLDDLIAAGELREMIIVMPDATCKYGFSFYTNSELNGNYEDYIVEDVVSYIDSNYRTIPSRDSRAIVGHCQGGYGAMKLAMKHPDVFGAVASHSAPLIMEAFSGAMPEVIAENPDGMMGPDPAKFNTSAVYALSAAFSPNLANPPFFVDLPFEYPSPEIIDGVWDRWLEHDLFTMLATYGANLASLRGLYFDCGDQDDFQFNLLVEPFHQALAAAGIEHEYEIFAGGTHCNKLYSRLATSLSFLSDALVAEELEDYTNVFFASLSPGLNMISLPLKPITPYTARSFAEELSATVVIQLDETRQRFVGFTKDAPDDGFAIEGGKGYIVNVPEGRVVAFTGAAWTNQPLVEASPSLAQSDGAWAFVVSGRLDVEQVGNLFYVTVRNTRTDAIATDVARSGYFATAFADLSRKNVVEVGDRLEVTVRTDEFVSDPFIYTVTPENIRQAYLPITLKNVDIPRQSLLLQNYPNPFNPETWIPYQLREPADVVIRVYNVQGRLVRKLDLRHRAAGFYIGRTQAAYWDGHNDAGEKVASGIYFYQLRAGDFSSTRRMLILK